MSRPLHIYRAVNAEPVDVVEEWNDDGTPYTVRYEPGEFTFGRQSGYLSRSGASGAGRRAGHAFSVIRSEPVVFLTRREKLLREIERLQAELGIDASLVSSEGMVRSVVQDAISTHEQRLASDLRRPALVDGLADEDQGVPDRVELDAERFADASGFRQRVLLGVDGVADGDDSALEGVHTPIVGGAS